MADNNGTVNIKGYYFSLVKNGLDQAQVSQVLADLAEKCKLLAESNTELKAKEEHYASLRQLAEKTVIDADVLANDIRARAENSAKAVTEDTHAKTSAMYRRTTNEIKGLAAKFISMVQEMEASIIEEANEKMSPDNVEELSSEIIAIDEIGESVEELSCQAHTVSEKEVGLEIIPPFDINTVMQIIEHLDNMPEISNVELFSRVDKPLVILYLKQPLDILKVLKALPDVEEVSESSGAKHTRRTLAIRTKVFEPSDTLNK